MIAPGTRKLLSLLATLTLGIACVAGLGAAPAAGGSGPAGAVPGAATTGACDWQRHSKRVVKRVVRNGKAKRVVRWKRWWSCLPAAPATDAAPAAAQPAAATPSEPTPAPVPPPEEEALPRRVSVKADDATPEAFSFGLSRPFVFAGEVVVELNNSGAQDPHNLNLRLEGGEEAPLEIPEAGPGERRIARFQLAAGSYRLWCSLPQHEEWGMSVALEVRDG